MGRDGTTAWPRGLCSASPGVDPCDAPTYVSPSTRRARGRRDCARSGRARGRPQGTGSRIVPQRRRPLRRLRRRSKFRRRAANRDRLPPPPCQDRILTKGVLKIRRLPETGPVATNAQCAQNSQVLELFGEESWRNVYAGQPEVRPPSAPTTDPDCLELKE